MIPGPTAKSFSFITSILLAVSFGSGAVAFVGLSILRVVLDPDKSHPGMIAAYIGFALTGVFALTLAIAVPVGLRAQRIARQELAAGYTTLLKQYDQVDGIDATTGRVVRPAKVRPPGSPALGSVTTGFELGPIDDIPTPLRLALRIVPASLGFFASVVILIAGVAIVWAAAADNSAFTVLVGIAFILPIFAFCAIIIIPLYVLPITSARHYASLLATEDPGSRAMPVQLDDYTVINEFIDPNAPKLPFARPRAMNFVVFESAHLVFYSRHRTQLLPFLVIPKSRIVTAAPGEPGSYNVPTTVFTVRKDDGSAIQVKLTLAIRVGTYTLNSLKTVRGYAAAALAWAGQGGA